MKLVVDASVAVEYLLRTAIGRSVEETLHSADLFAPELMDAEVLAVARHLVMRGKLGEPRARELVDDLGVWPLERVSHRSLLPAAWALRHKLTVYDALYIALADQLGGAVLTADGPLARTPSLGVPIRNVRV